MVRKKIFLRTKSGLQQIEKSYVGRGTLCIVGERVEVLGDVRIRRSRCRTARLLHGWILEQFKITTGLAPR